MLIAVVQLVAIFSVPLLILRLRDRGLIRTFGTIAMAYFWGIVAAVVILGAVLLIRSCGRKAKASAESGNASENRQEAAEASEHTRCSETPEATDGSEKAAAALCQPETCPSLRRACRSLPAEERDRFRRP